MARRWRALEPFRVGNFSLFFSGQVLSNAGTWFQNLALSLVVVQVSGSAQALSLVTVAQFAPIMLLSVPAGWLADRWPPRRIVLLTSFASAVTVGVLAVQVSAADPSVASVLMCVVVLGVIHTFDRIASQTFVFELVGEELLTRAASLSTISLAAARSIGPGLAGLTFAGFGATVCMLVNAASFLVVFAFILAIRPAKLHARPTRPERRSIVSSLRELRSNRPIVALLIVNVVVTMLALNLMLVLTATVTLTFGGDATALGAAHALNAIGAIVGGFVAASLARVSVRSLIPACLVFGAVLAANAASPTLSFFLWMAPLLGLGVGYYQGVLYGAAQGSVRPDEIGRTMSLVTLGNYGVVPFGALLLGSIIDATSGHAALGLGAVGCLACAVFLAIVLRARPEGRR